MDKINELRNKLEELNKKRNENLSIIMSVNKDNFRIINENEIIKYKLEKLNDLFMQLQAAPNIIKKSKRRMLMSTIIGITSIIITILLCSIIPQYLLVQVIEALGVFVFLGSMLTYSTAFSKYHFKKKLTNSYNIEDIQKEIKEKEKQKSNNIEKEQENIEIAYDIDLETEKINLEIKDTIIELSKYEEIKNSVIKKLLDNNFISDEILAAFTQTSEETKVEEGYQKTKKIINDK